MATALLTADPQDALARAAPFALTDTERAARTLRDDIVAGGLAPDAKLKMRELKLRYGFGASPLREALAQLSAQGYVVQASQKGFRVPPLSKAHLDDITQSRQLIEGEAFRLAIEHGDAAWEAEIAGSYHLYERAVGRLAKHNLAFDDAYEQVHFRFHRALVAACPLVSLLEFSERLYRQGSRYRRLMLQSITASSDAIAEHRRLRDLALARKSEAAVKTLRGHISVTGRVLQKKLSDDQRMPLRGKTLQRR